MLQELNYKIRKAILIVGGSIIIYKLIDAARKEQLDSHEDFQQKEFDDIW